MGAANKVPGNKITAEFKKPRKKVLNGNKVKSKTFS